MYFENLIEANYSYRMSAKHCCFNLEMALYGNNLETVYRDDLKFSDRQVWTNNVDPDQTAPRKQYNQGLNCLPFRLHLLDALFYDKATLFIL